MPKTERTLTGQSTNPVTFDSDFVGGNGQSIDIIEDPETVEVAFAAECKGCPRPLWFHFRLSGLRGRSVRARLVNAGTCLGSPKGWGENRVVYRFEGKSWQRAEPCKLSSESGGPIQAEFAIPGSDDNVEVAFCYPYQLSDWWEAARDSGGLHQAVLGYSNANRPIRRFATAVDERPDRPGVYVLSRQHAGETPGSWVLDGMVRALGSSSERKVVTWWFVPFVNIDGVEKGSYGKDAFPHDRNRAWASHSPLPEIAAIMGDIKRSRRLCRLRLLLDLHAPGHATRDIFFYEPSCDPESPCIGSARRLHDEFFARVPQYLIGETTWRRMESEDRVPPPVRSGPRASEFGCSIDGCLGICMETTYQGIGEYVCTIEDYRQIGVALVEAIHAWLEQFHR